MAILWPTEPYSRQENIIQGKGSASIKKAGKKGKKLPEIISAVAIKASNMSSTFT